MSTLKKWLLGIIVAIALLQTGLGGLADILGVRPFGVISAEHGWHDGLIMMLLAIVVAIAVK